MVPRIKRPLAMVALVCTFPLSNSNTCKVRNEEGKNLNSCGICGYGYEQTLLWKVEQHTALLRFTINEEQYSLFTLIGLWFG